MRNAYRTIFDKRFSPIRREGQLPPPDAFVFPAAIDSELLIVRYCFEAPALESD
jgi:hypothetical protein